MYFTGTIYHNIYTAIFKFNLITSRVRNLGLRARVRVFADVYYGNLISIIQSNSIRID